MANIEQPDYGSPESTQRILDLAEGFVGSHILEHTLEETAAEQGDLELAALFEEAGKVTQYAANLLLHILENQ